MIHNFSLSRQKASCSMNRVTEACFPADSSHLCLNPSFRSVTLISTSPSSLLKVYYEVFTRVVIHVYKYDDWSLAVAKTQVELLSCALLSCGEGSGLSASVSPLSQVSLRLAKTQLVLRPPIPHQRVCNYQ